MGHIWQLHLSVLGPDSWEEGGNLSLCDHQHEKRRQNCVRRLRICSQSTPSVCPSLGCVRDTGKIDISSPAASWGTENPPWKMFGFLWALWRSVGERKMKALTSGCLVELALSSSGNFLWYEPSNFFEFQQCRNLLHKKAYSLLPYMGPLVEAWKGYWFFLSLKLLWKTSK